MADALKTFFSPALVKRLAGEVVASWPAFSSKKFIAQASAGLDELELLDRGKHIANALAAHLPADYPNAIEILVRSLAAEHATDELLGNGMAPFFYLPHTIFVVERGLEHFELSMRAQCELTKRFTAEFSIRHFIAKDPERTFAQLEAWAGDPNAHVRRLVSEGTRLRLPWGMRVAWLDDHPERVLALLERLKDDPASVVRRSVANNLNDLGKVHPDLLIRTCAAWLDGASAERRALVEHALRSAIKRAEPAALALLGYGAKPAFAVEDIRFEPRRVAIGNKVTLAFTLRSTAKQPQELLVDLAVHFVKARGETSPKVFKLKRVALGARERVELKAAISLAVHTTRKPQAGKHAVDVVVNGVAAPLGAFDVVSSGGGARRRAPRATARPRPRAR
ncbi:MAG: DNA alkylation repair protein [Myxococcota bacterium]|nr:DNA alkylation repair protein [Myxococcota bacterium]